MTSLGMMIFSSLSLSLSSAPLPAAARPKAVSASTPAPTTVHVQFCMARSSAESRARRGRAGRADPRQRSRAEDAVTVAATGAQVRQRLLEVLLALGLDGGLQLRRRFLHLGGRTLP